MSSEDFKSLIVTDPDLIDEGIDVSGLRTTTDTNRRLLAAIENYPGILYDPTSYSYLSDLNRLYASGLPEIDTSEPTTPAPPSGGGGGGEGGGGGTTPTPPDSIGGFDPGVVPGPSGFIGLDPEYDLDPKDFVDDYTYSPFTNTPVDTSITVEDLTGLDMSGTIPGRPDIFDINQTGDPSQNPGSINVGDQRMAAGPFDYLQNDSISTIANPDIFNSYAGVDDPQIGDPGFTGYTPSFETPEQQNKVENIFGKVGQTVEGALTELGKIPGAIVDTANKTVDVFGKKLDVGQTIGGLIVNKAFGFPATLAIKVLENVLPKQDPRKGALDDLYDMDGITIGSGLMKGYNPISGGFLNTITKGRLGEPIQYGLQKAYDDTIGNITSTLQSQYGLTKTEIDQIKAGTLTSDMLLDQKKAINPIMSKTYGKPTVTNLVKDLADTAKLKKEEKTLLDRFSGDVDPSGEGTGDVITAEQIAEADRLGISGDIGVEGLDDETDRFGGGTDRDGPESSAPPTGTNRPGGDSRDDSPAPSAPPAENAQRAAIQDAARAGMTVNQAKASVGMPANLGDTGGGQSNAGKIVCTMMNDSYGFGSFRNKIWMKFHKDLSPEYQKGYHKLFLPLVKLSKTNKVVKKVLEHIAVHSTIDMRQATRGKTHLLGRVYRKILLPLCYLVGKYAK